MTNKITKDGFIWLIVTDRAKEIMSSGIFELYELMDDDSESLIQTHDTLNDCLGRGCDIGIEVGFINNQIKTT